MDLPLLKSLAARGPVGLDVQGFVRVRENGHSGQALVFRQWPDMAEGLALMGVPVQIFRAVAGLILMLSVIGNTYLSRQE